MRGKTSFGLQSTVFVGIVVAAVVFLNLAGSNVAGRLDLTEDGIYTLSKASRKIVGSLDDDLRIKVFFSRNLPSPYNNNFRYLVDQLEEYRSASRGKIRFEVFDPGENPDVESEALRYGIEPVQINVIENDEVQIKRVLMGLVVLYGDRIERMPVIGDVSDLEYRLSAAVRRITRDEKTVAGFVSLGEDSDAGGGTRLLRQMLREDYAVRDIVLSKDTAIPADVKVLVVPGPERDLEAWERFRIDQFLMSGGRVAFLIDRADADLQTQYAAARPLTLDDWTRSYGFSVADRLIVDTQSSAIQVAQRRGWMTIANVVKYPYFPEITRFDEDEALTRNLDSLTVFFASPVEDRSAGTGVTFVPLARTSEHTALRSLPTAVNPFEKIGREEFTESGVVVAAAVKGTFGTAFPDGAPEGVSGDRGDGRKSPETRIVVVGDADFIKDEFSRDPGQLVFALNIIDWLADETGLIGIRSHGSVNRPLGDVAEDVRGLIKGVNLFGPPLIVLVVGLGAWQVRRRGRSRFGIS